MQNLTKQYIINEFNQDKERAIKEYLIEQNTNFVECEYTQGAKVLVDVNTRKAYSRSGLLYVVILNDQDYLAKVEQKHHDEIIAYADSLFAPSEEETEEE